MLTGCQDPYLLGGGTPSEAFSPIHTGGGDSGPSVCRGPSIFLIFTTLQAISHSGGPKSLGPAERICIRRTVGFWEGSREHRWQPCNWPSGPTCTIFGSLRNPQFSSWRHGEPKMRVEGSQRMTLDFGRSGFLLFRCAKIRTFWGRNAFRSI